MLVMAHRGYSGVYPENTMLAFREAASVGCDGVELDVHETKDGQLVVIHDEAVDRTTDGTGFIRDLTFKQLRKLNAAQRFDGKFAPEKIPSFDEFCEWLSGESIFANIEIKTDNTYYPGIEEKTWKTIEKYGVEKQVMFSGFNHFTLRRLQEIVPDYVELGALVEHKSGVQVFPGDYCKASGFQCYHPPIGILNDENVKNCKDNGVKLNVWTVNDMEGLEKLYRWGCEGIITNFPGVAYTWLKGQKKAK